MNFKNLFISLFLCFAVSVPAFASNYYEVPQDTDVHLYMDYRAIANTQSNQYKLEQVAYTDPNGLRCYTDEEGNVYYLVALAEYYGTEIGSTYEVTLDNGSCFNIMLGDCKDTSDTNNKYGRSAWNFIRQINCTNIIEFIVADDKLPEKVTNWGTVTALDFFNGNITKIKATGQKWSAEMPKIYYC